ncbi:helix-turn-helix transcriptional regulator [Kluyvera sp. EC_51]|uniref:helix-turn-helix domain-containing protein n=1 Tax=Kluyvera sp. EC_51 TaxID=2584089 RepID=UPI001C701D2F|nr:helix-turn-helix transcriptional regulator [Kluyvera sp. EC_51]MBW9462338.1 helix-turn-helix transcriptional regulator [Kluyvera sp. EC_51]
MKITGTAQAEFLALPTHSKAKVIHAIDRFLLGDGFSTLVRVDDNLTGIQTEGAGIQRVIFIRRTVEGEVILGVAMKKKKRFNQNDALAFLADRLALSKPANHECWKNFRKKALTVTAVKSGFENEVLKETLQKTLMKWRSIAGLTRQQLANKMGVSYKYLCSIEANPSKVSIITLYHYAKKCNVKSPQIYL